MRWLLCSLWMSIRSKSESLGLSCHSRMAHVSLAQTSAVTVPSYLWLVGENSSLQRWCWDAPCVSSHWLLEQPQGWASFPDKANTLLKQHLEPKCFAVPWQTWAFPGTTEVLCNCYSLLKERRSGLCSLQSAKWIILGSLFFHVFHLPSDPSDLMEPVSH